MLTDTAIKGLKPKNKLYRKTDTGGLLIEVKPSAKKVWRFRYKYADKENMLSIGEYPIISLKDARVKRDEYKNLLTNNIDPSAHIKEQKAEIIRSKQTTQTLRFYFDEWYTTKQSGWSINYQKEILKRANKHLLPYLADIPIKEIKTTTIIEILKKIEKQGKIETLHKVKNIIQQMMSYAVGLGILEYNPAREISTKIFKPKVVKNYARITDPKKLGQLLNDIDNYNGSYQVVQALRLAPFVFLRPIELVSLKWKYIDWSKELIKIPEEVMKMKRPHIVPLTTQTIAILQEIKLLEANSPYIFFSDKSPKNRHISRESLRGALRNMGYSNDDITPHGFRGTASTLLHEQGYNSDHIEMQLAHQEGNKVKGAYNHAEYLAERTQMMKEWAEYLDGLKST